MAGEEVQEQLHAFLNTCKQSGNAAYAEFKGLLEKLENPSTRSAARRFLAAVEQFVKSDCDDSEAVAKYNFNIHELPLGDGGDDSTGGNGQHRRQSLTLLEMSSIFIPEDWSFTFYEGLCRLPDTGFQDRDMAELGCGNGWVSIAMADRWSPRKVYGLDINPRAIKVAWINLYLNALNPDGTPIVDGEGKTLLDRVEFYVSDLLEFIREKKIPLDRVVGCIPQVLSPDPKVTLKIVSETMSEEFLYALSNYCGLQGFVEDQFGLGLIARAVEEAIEVVKPSGAIILNMGGRPGQAVCERLFKRRGFHIKMLWQTRVNQAADTDIQALVEIERSSRHRFEFYMGPGQEEPISARTAYAYSKAGGAIAHGLAVYECRLQQPTHVKNIFRFLSAPGHDATRSALDLSFSSQAVEDEKIAFLAYLAHTLQAKAHFSCEPPAGNERLRSLIASFFRLYFRIPLSVQNLLVVPSRAVAIEAILRLYSPKLALVETSLTRSLPRHWVSSMPSEAPLVVLEAPPRTDLVLQLGRSLKPQVIIVSLPDFEMRATMAFQQLLEMSAEIGARLFVDISEHLELSSRPPTNGVLQYLAEHALPPHAAIICGLVKNQVYTDLEVGFVLSESRTLLQAIANAGELTYTRAPSMPQLYYGCLFNELLSFQIPEKHTLATRTPVEEDAAFAERFVGPTACIRAAFDHPAISTTRQPFINERDVVFMDCGENALPTPAAVKQYLFEGFGRQNISDIEMDPRPELSQLVSNRFGIVGKSVKEVFVSDGSASLLSRLMAACSEEGGTLLHPVAFSGAFVATAHYFGAKTCTITTEVKDNFKLTPSQLAAALKGISRPWLMLSAPVVNPSGALYSTSELSLLLDVCVQNGVRVVLETSYTGLEFEGNLEKLDLGKYFTEGIRSNYALAILGDISKELSAGGLGFGFAVIGDSYFLEVLQQMAPGSKPHLTTRYTAKKLLTLLNQDDNPLREALSARRKTLQQRAVVLAEVLSRNGWEPLLPSAGLFLLARPVAFEGRSFTYRLPESSDEKGNSSAELKTVVLNSESIHDALYCSVGIAVNCSSWTSVPGYCRFVISLEQAEFEEVLVRLEEFYKLFLASSEGT